MTEERQLGDLAGVVHELEERPEPGSPERGDRVDQVRQIAVPDREVGVAGVVAEHVAIPGPSQEQPSPDPASVGQPHRLEHIVEPAEVASEQSSQGAPGTRKAPDPLVQSGDTSAPDSHVRAAS